MVEKAVRTSINGRPGAVYLDISGTLVNAEVDEDEIHFLARCPEPARPLARCGSLRGACCSCGTSTPSFISPALIYDAISLLKTASRPLVIVGKGCGYARAEHEVRSFVKAAGVPFLATPMGKGVIPDDDPQSIAAARSLALGRADVIVLLAARLNWILHFGLPPRFSKGAPHCALSRRCASMLQQGAAASRRCHSPTPRVV